VSSTTEAQKAWNAPPPSRRASRWSSTTHSTPESAEPKMAAQSLCPITRKHAAMIHRNSGGLSSRTCPAKCGVIQSPPRSISTAFSA